MDNSDQRPRRDQLPFRDTHRPPADRPLPPPPSTGRSLSADRCDGDLPAYTLMVAGRRTGKTAFLRLLLDTSVVSPTASQEQLASVAKFVQGCAGYTSHIRTVSVNVDLAVGLPAADPPALHTLALSLVDTPALDFDDPAASQRTVDEIMRHVDTRFSESVEDAHKAYAGDHHVHLCVYFLDPDTIVPPPSVPVAPAPLVSRARNNSLSQPDVEPLILEPPVTTNPLLCRPALPQADIATIRRLSVRVNVLPVVGRADLLTNDRLAAVKIAVRRDLAAAGIGFGIFDNTPPHPVFGPDAGLIVPKQDPHAHAPGASPPPAPIAATPLPYALIAPDAFAHSDGVARPAPSRHELVLQYSPAYHSAPQQRPLLKIVPGKWTRSFRWGSLDCMDANHCDFLQLRGAIFHHMKTLQKYTREFLLERFRADILSQNPPPALARAQRSPLNARLPPMAQGTRPILAIDTAPDHLGGRRASMSVARSVGNGESNGSVPAQAQAQAALMPDLSPKTASSTRSARIRTKKITVACNFCRSRKLKCDGGRPACSQCFKRSNPCDYMAGHKRRGNGKRRRADDGSDSEGEGEGDSAAPSAELEPPQSLSLSLSPEVSSLSHSRRSSNANGSDTASAGAERERERDRVGDRDRDRVGDRDRDRDRDGVTLPPLNGTLAALERHGADAGPTLAPLLLPVQAPPPTQQTERAYVKHELPPIATLPPVSPEQTLPPLRVPGEVAGLGHGHGHGHQAHGQGHQAQAQGQQSQGQGQSQNQAQSQARRRTSSAASTKARQNGYSSKIVACNFCRARKTRCDGVHPSCGSCARRSLPCNYVNDREASNPKGRPKAAPASASSSTSVPGAGPSASSQTQTQTQTQTPPSVHAYNGYANGRGAGEQDLKRERERGLDAEPGHPSKKMRVAEEFGAGVVSVSQLT